MFESAAKSKNGILNAEKEIRISFSTDNMKTYIREIKFKSDQHKSKKKKYCFLCRSQTNSLLVILGAYATIFLVATIILVMSVLKLQISNFNEKFSKNMVETNENLYKSKYKSILKEFDTLFSNKFFKEFIWPLKSSTFNCSNLSNVKNFKYLTSGWTKSVFSFEFNEQHYALKTVNIDGVDIKNCSEKYSFKTCIEKASAKMYKEYIFSKELSHSNIIKVLAWCVSSSNISNDFGTVHGIVTELCTPIDIILLLKMSFYQRLKVMLDLSRLMVYLTESPLGSVAINDFQRQQFVMCRNTIKLTDMDDLSVEEPKCSDFKECSYQNLLHELKPNKNTSLENHLQCINSFCIGYNEKQNIINTYKHFVNLFLNITTPVKLKKDIEALFNSYTSTWSARVVLKQSELLYDKYNSLKNEKSHS